MSDKNFYGDYYSGATGEQLPMNRYENIFKIGYNKDYPFFNIFKTVTIPDNLDDGYFETIKPLPTDTWTNLSYIYYNNIDLWWLIALVNNVFDPFTMPTTLKILKPEYIDSVIGSIQSQIK